MKKQARHSAGFAYSSPQWHAPSMLHYHYSNRRIALALVVTVLLGAGCISQTTAIQSRVAFDITKPCDYSSPAAPPCTYQTTPDGQWVTYNLDKSLREDPTHATIVAHNTSSGAEKRVQIPIGNHSFFSSVGLSDNGKISYVGTRELKPDPTKAFVYKIDFDANRYTKVAEWPGGLLDLHIPKNMMLRFNEDNRFLELTNLEGTVIKEVLAVNNDQLILRGIISPDGTQIILDSLKPSTNELETMLTTINSGEIETLKLPDGFRPLGWQGSNALIIENNEMVTSTFAL